MRLRWGLVALVKRQMLSGTTAVTQFLPPSLRLVVAAAVPIKTLQVLVEVAVAVLVPPLSRTMEHRAAAEQRIKDLRVGIALLVLKRVAPVVVVLGRQARTLPTITARMAVMASHRPSPDQASQEQAVVAVATSPRRTAAARAAQVVAAQAVAATMSPGQPEPQTRAAVAAVGPLVAVTVQRVVVVLSSSASPTHSPQYSQAA